MPTDTDRIQRTVHIETPVERVWELVTSAEHVGRWFADAGAEIDLRPGGALSLTWADDGTFHGRVEVVEPPRRFVFRWLATVGVQDEPRPGNSTLAEFTLAGDGGGTRLTVVESGFSLLEFDHARRTAALESHTEGWRIELGHLVDHVRAVAAGA